MELYKLIVVGCCWFSLDRSDLAIADIDVFKKLLEPIDTNYSQQLNTIKLRIFRYSLGNVQ
jgi:hypothetical protein